MKSLAHVKRTVWKIKKNAKINRRQSIKLTICLLVTVLLSADITLTDQFRQKLGLIWIQTICHSDKMTLRMHPNASSNLWDLFIFSSEGFFYRRHFRSD